MNRRDCSVALLVVALWGLNFPATAFALQQFPPILMAALRFTLIAIPALMFVPRPRVSWKLVVAIGATLGIVQFSFLYAGIAAGMPAGLASVVIQASAPLTIVFAAVGLRERLSPWQAVGVGVSVVGLAAVVLRQGMVSAVLPTILVLCGAAGWALGNVATRVAAASDAFRLTMWWSVVPPIPLALLSWAIEGSERIGASFATIVTPEAVLPVLGLLYVVGFSSVVAYALWASLLGRHPSSRVAPFSMLVPVVGMLSSWLVLGEVPHPFDLSAGALVIAGVLWASRSPGLPPSLAAVRP
ncbi:EamA family transporter [Agromyces tropicus]|uniref:EamA family transporter n=1 Tax=Agromyces tropicus TaxID=555371 RepID=A0ABP5FHI7_9MICO